MIIATPLCDHLLSSYEDFVGQIKGTVQGNKELFHAIMKVINLYIDHVVSKMAYNCITVLSGSIMLEHVSTIPTLRIYSTD